MKKIIFLLFISIVASFSAHAQAFNLKELLSLKDHDITFFHNYVKEKGYTYEKSKYDAKKENYAYVFLENIADDLHEIKYAATSKGATITFGTTDVNDYEQLKKELELLQFKFVKFVPKQEHGRSVLMIVYTDGNTKVHLYNSYIEDKSHEFVRYYRIKVL
ncbi:MAG: hypothetical protein ACHQD8_06695 [Chitinophagales bacterium]